jgi:hypothetical protein
LRQSLPWLAFAVQKTDDEAKQSAVKVAHAVEKFRRLVIRMKNVGRDSVIAQTLAQLLNDVAVCFNSAFEQVWKVLHPSLQWLTGIYSPEMRNSVPPSSTRSWCYRKTD